MFSGVVSFGIAHLEGGPLAPWQGASGLTIRPVLEGCRDRTDSRLLPVLFVLVGALTVVWAIVIGVFLPDSPMRAKVRPANASPAIFDHELTKTLSFSAGVRRTRFC